MRAITDTLARMAMLFPRAAIVGCSVRALELHISSKLRSFVAVNFGALKGLLYLSGETDSLNSICFTSDHTGRLFAINFGFLNERNHLLSNIIDIVDVFFTSRVLSGAISHG